MALFRRKGSDIWYLKTRFNGKQILKSCNTADRKAAENFAREFQRELILGASRQAKGSLRLSEAIEKAYHQRWRHTIDGEAVRKKLYKITDMIGDIDLDEIGRDVIQRLKDGLFSRNIAPSTVNRYLASLKTLLNVAYTDWEIIDKLPSIKLNKESRGRTRVITADEEKALLKFFNNRETADWSVFADLTVVLIETGMRLSEALSLTPGHIDSTNRTINLRPDDTKSGKARTLPCSNKCWTVAESRLNSEYLFPVTKFHTAQVFRKARAELRLADISAHVCRHTFASRMLAKGQPIQIVQKWLGHASIQMTVDRYGHLDITSLKQSLNGR